MKLTCPQLSLLKETDIEGRARERANYSGGGIEEKAKLLIHKLRTGELKQNNIATAAALGDEASKLLGLKEPKLNKTNINVMTYSALDASDLTRSEVVGFAVDCAEQALPFFEARFPDDDRPRLAINAARSCVADAVTVVSAERAFLNTADADADAARSAADAVVWAVYIDSYAWAPASTYLNFINAAYAASAAVRAGVPEEWVIKRLIQYILGEA